MKRIAVIGAGISGLSLAYYLKKKFGNTISIDILEREKRTGGWIYTKEYYGQIFECGPHTFRVDAKENAILELINELDLTSSLIEANASSKKRYIAKGGKIHQLPQTFLSLFTTRVGRTILKAAILEPLKSKSGEEDESVESFFSRRFGAKFVNTFVDPYITGIYGGSATSLSMRFTFPKIWEYEKKYRSIVLSLLFKSSQDKTSGKICTFKDGMEVLPKKLEMILFDEIKLQTQVNRIEEHESSVEVHIKNSSSKSYDHLFSTISPRILNMLLSSDDPLKELLPPVPMNSLLVVHLGYKSDFSNVVGFGFLAGRSEEAMLLGILFDSDCFPEQNILYKTRLSVFLGGAFALHLNTLSDDAIVEHAYKFVNKYLGIHEDAAYTSVFKAPYAIPHYPVGHTTRLNELNNYLANRKITLLGAGLLGASLTSCVNSAKEIAEKFSFSS